MEVFERKGLDEFPGVRCVTQSICLEIMLGQELLFHVVVWNLQRSFDPNSIELCFLPKLVQYVLIE